MKFAAVTEEIILRRKELVVLRKDGKIPKSALETFFLYIVILLHSFGRGVCELTLPELCEIYELDLDNSYRRLKALREKGWIEKTKKEIRPILVHRKKNSKTVIVTDNPDLKTVTVTGENDTKTVMVTDKNCNDYSKTGEKTVTITEKNGETSITANGYPASKTLLNLKTSEDDNNNRAKTDVVVDVVRANFLSKFSIEEIRRYVEICVRHGQTVKNPEGLAITLRESGAADDFIQAMLYPEQIQTQQIIVEQQIEYDDNFEHFDARSFAEEWAETLEYLRELGADVSERRSNYAPEIWARLMEALNG